MKKLSLICTIFVLLGSLHCSPKKECKNACTGENITQCKEKLIQVCQKATNGCFAWKTQEDCDKINKNCDNSSTKAKCVETCSAPCPKNASKQCKANKLQVCTKKTNGCLEWEQSEDCAKSNQSCQVIDGKSKCSKSCPNPCKVKGSTRCQENQILACKSDGKDCLNWYGEKDCQALGMQCKESAGKASCSKTSGMKVRKPQKHKFDCKGTDMYFWDIDYTCTFKVNNIDTLIYVQSTPTSCITKAMNPQPNYSNGTKSWIKIKSKWHPLPAAYNAGGGHKNDWIKIDYENASYTFYHASFGFGWRACTAPNCIRVCKKGKQCFDGSNMVTDGCSRKVGSGPPSLPIICVKTNLDGTVPKMLDPWKKHPSQSSSPLLPCKGDIAP